MYMQYKFVLFRNAYNTNDEVFILDFRWANFKLFSHENKQTHIFALSRMCAFSRLPIRYTPI